MEKAERAITHRSPSSRNRVVHAPVFILLILLLSYLINTMDRNLFSILAVEIRTHLNLSLEEIGFAATVFTLGMGLAGLPTAWLFNKMPRKYVAIVGLIIFSAATVLTARSYGYADLLFYRFISGMGESIQLIAVLSMATSYFHRHTAIATGAINSMFGLGAIIGPNLSVVLLKGYDWQAPFAVFGAAGFVMVIVCLRFVTSEFSEFKPASVRPVPRHHKKESRLASTTSTTWLLAAATALGGLVIYAYLGLYPTFLRSHLGFSPREAAFAASCYGAGGFLSLLCGWLGHRFGNRRILQIALCVMSISGGLLFTPLGHSIYLHGLLSFIFGCMASGVLFANFSSAIIHSIHPRISTSFGASLFVSSFYIPAAFAGYILAVLTRHLGWVTGSSVMLVGGSIAALVLVTLARNQQFGTAETTRHPNAGGESTAETTYLH